MKKQVFLIITTIFLSLTLYAQLIPDYCFKRKINQHLGQPLGYEPTIADLNGINGTLNAYGETYYEILSIEGAQYLINLSTLNLAQNVIEDISPISGLTSLIHLDLRDNLISDISPISGLTSLIHLDLRDNLISDISPISGLTSLVHLDLIYNQIGDISALSSLTGLTDLRLGGNDISDISIVSGLTNLIKLFLFFNNISDISAVVDLTSLTHLDLLSNDITDISYVAGLECLTYLRLRGNEISDISAIVENIEFGYENSILDLVHNPLSQEAFDVHIPILESRPFTTLIYNDTPNNYAACYPNPARNATEVSINTSLEWSGNFSLPEADYDVWLGEASENLVYAGIGVAISDTLFSFSPNLNANTDYWWKVIAHTATGPIWSGLWHFDTNDISGNNENSITHTNFDLVGNYPNPFNPSTIIEFSIQNDSDIDISIFNIKGQKIKTLANNEFSNGIHSIIWNGDDEYGYSVSSGVYLYKLNVNGRTEAVKKCLLLK